MSAGRMQYSKLNENATGADWPLRRLKPVAAISDQIRRSIAPVPVIYVKGPLSLRPLDWSTLAEVEMRHLRAHAAQQKAGTESGAWTPPDSYGQRLSTSENGRCSRPRCLIRQRSKSKRSWPKKGSPSNTIVGTPQ